MTLNNVVVYNKGAEWTNEICKGPTEVLERMLPKDLYLAMKSMDEMFENPSKAREIYEKYKPTYIKFSGNHKDYSSTETFNKFFTEA